MPDDVKTRIKTNSFFAMSIHVRDKPVGLFYADRRSLDCKLDEQAYKQFRQICQFAAKGLANLAKWGIFQKLALYSGPSSGNGAASYDASTPYDAWKDV